MNFNKNMTKSEIEQALQNMGDYVKMDNLNRFLKQSLALDKKKFVYEKLAEIYEKKGMFTSAAKMHNFIALCTIAFSEKIRHYVKEAELYIKAGAFIDADEAVKRALSEANIMEKENIHKSIKEFYKKQGEAYERDMRKAQAIKLYEKFLQMNLDSVERDEIKKKLMILYEKVGKLNEYFSLKDSKYGSETRRKHSPNSK